jgi:hypothetical protein
MTDLRTPNRGPCLASLPRVRRCDLPQGEDRFAWRVGEIVFGQPRRGQVVRPEDLAEPLRRVVEESA